MYNSPVPNSTSTIITVCKLLKFNISLELMRRVMDVGYEVVELVLSFMALTTLHVYHITLLNI